MKYGKVRGLGKLVSRIILGTIIVNTKKLDASFSLLDDALSLGINTFDITHVYNGGETNELLGSG